jgi:2-octaprenyl-6-methoxyphenol hydroxylase
MANDTDFDIAIIGGGSVGISLACALGQIEPAPRVVLIEAHDYKNLPPPGFDARTVALSYSSRQIFEGLQLWQSIEQRGISPIEMIHISDRGHPGMTRLTANEQGVEALGYVIENRILGEALFARLSSFSNITLMAPARMQQLDFKNDRVILQGSMNDEAFQLTTRLVVAADGTESFVRKFMNISQCHWDYQQTAVIANVACDRPHNHVAYERFTRDGPMALLPLTDLDDAKNRYGLVWTVPQNRVEQVLALNDEQFRTELAVHFGERAGKFVRIGKRASYPLGLSHINEHVRHRLAFIGNAAHTLHPVAGQGFNLGLRDVAALAQVLQEALAAQQDPGDLDVLQAYAKWRRRDHIQTAVFTDSLVRVFSTDFTPLVLVRNAGLLAMEMFAPLRKRLGRHAMGYIGRASLLARGLGL